VSATDLLSVLVGIGALAVVAELGARCFPRRPALGHVLWLVVLVRSLVPSIPLVSALGVTEVVTGSPFLASRESAALAETTGAGPWHLGLVDALLFVWALGTFGSLARAVHASLVLRRLVRLGRPGDVALTAEVARESRRLGVRPPVVRSLAWTRSPFLYGLRRPILFWPARASTTARRARASVIRHELAHIARRDPWTAWIEIVAQSVWWWNPIVRYAVAQSRRYKELACDARAMEAQPDDRHAYGRALIEATDATGADGTTRVDAASALPAQSLGWVGSGSRMRERLRSLYAPHRSGTIPASAFAPVLVLFALSLPGLTSAAPAPDVVATAEPLSDSDRAALERLGAESFEELEHLAMSEVLRDPNDGRAHYRLGWALVGQGRYEDAIDAFRYQYELGYTPSYASYNVACCHALLGQVDDAIEWLEKSVESGYDDPLQIEQDEDLALLRADPRFRALIDELLAQADRGPGVE
jgi:beta-lactamase regulating signal transducer with metallopeptidase domain